MWLGFCPCVFSWTSPTSYYFERLPHSAPLAHRNWPPDSLGGVVAGVLRVVEHLPSVIRQELMLLWFEVRVEELCPDPLFAAAPVMGGATVV